MYCDVDLICVEFIFFIVWVQTKLLPRYLQITGVCDNTKSPIKCKQNNDIHFFWKYKSGKSIVSIIIAINITVSGRKQFKI